MLLKTCLTVSDLDELDLVASQMHIVRIEDLSLHIRLLQNLKCTLCWDATVLESMTSEIQSKANRH